MSKYQPGDKVRIVDSMMYAGGRNNRGMMDHWAGEVMTIKNYYDYHEVYGETYIIRDYEGLTYEQLEKLDDNCFLDPEDCQNCSPSIAEFMEFMRDHEGVTAHGYVVSDNREDYRVSVEGISKFGNITYEESLEFIDLCRCADEFTCTKEELYCWYD